MGRPDRISWTALAVAVVVGAIVWTRLAVDGIQPYGTDGAQYLEHVARLRVMEQWREYEGWNLWEFLIHNDSAYPAMLHLLSIPVGVAFGHSAEAAAATGLGWFLLLATATGSAAARISGRRAVGALAIIGVLMVPSLQGLATRYYFDLPMLALLWTMVALILGTRDRHPVLGGGAVGVLFFIACTVKWAALPHGAVLLSAAFLVPVADRPSWRDAWLQRGLALVVTATVAALLLTGYMTSILGTSSFGHQAHITVPAAAALDASPSALLTARLAAIGTMDLVFFPLRLPATVLSPALALAWVALLPTWSRAGRTGLGFLLLTVVGTLGFLLVMVPVLDDRFILPIVPSLVVVGAIGFDALDARHKRFAGPALLGLAALVSVDFHFAPPRP